MKSSSVLKLKVVLGFFASAYAMQSLAGFLPDAGAEVCYPGQLAPVCYHLERLAGNTSAGRNYNYTDPLRDPSFPSSADPDQYLVPLNILNLNGKNFGSFVSKNYKLGEFLSREKGVLGILSPEAVQKMELLRSDFNKPVRITSGYRSPGYNSGVSGSAKWSRHMYGDGFDFYVSGVSLSRMLQVCEGRGGFGLKYNDGHLHCDWRSVQLNKAYYGPTRSRPAELQRRLKAELLTNLSAGASLEVRKIPGGWELATLGFANEEGSLLHEWKIVNSETGTLWGSRAPIVKTSLPRGTYQISVEVGGQFHLEKSVTIP